MLGHVYRAAAELEPTPAGKFAALETRVLALKECERFTEARTSAGNDPPQQLNVCRFHRLQAEADLLRLKEQLAPAPKK
jgi:hypothetical protein